jgi:hypothetical protein
MKTKWRRDDQLQMREVESRATLASSGIRQALNGVNHSAGACPGAEAGASVLA